MARVNYRDRTYRIMEPSEYEQVHLDPTPAPTLPPFGKVQQRIRASLRPCSRMYRLGRLPLIFSREPSVRTAMRGRPAKTARTVLGSPAPTRSTSFGDGPRPLRARLDVIVAVDRPGRQQWVVIGV